jgi:ketosteroid isomerase-like protein
MRPSHLTKSFSWRGLLIEAVFFALAPFAACTQGTLLLSAGDLDAAPAVAEIRILPGPASAAIEQDLRSADRALIQAVGTNDRPAAARLLDSEFTWIDRDGRSRSKSDLLNWIGLLSAGPDANFTLRPYGRVALITGTHRLAPDNVPALFARVWVRQPSGWRLLLYQETAPADPAAPDLQVPALQAPNLQVPNLQVKDARFGITRAQWPADCDNPCRTLPYKSLSSDAQEIVVSFMAGEKAVFEGDAEAAGRILGDDVLFVTPDSAQPLDKDQRTAALRNFRHAGQVDLPPAVASMALWVFGNAAVMSVDQESPAGELLRATRIWAKRDGRWQLTFSQQTLVQ